MCNCFNKERQMIAYFNWKVKFYTVAGNCSMCNISFPTWYKPVHVEMKTFEGGRSSGTSVHRQTNPTFLQGTGLCVQMNTFRVLDAGNMLLLDPPHLSYPLAFKQWDT